MVPRTTHEDRVRTWAPAKRPCRPFAFSSSGSAARRDDRHVITREGLSGWARRSAGRSRHRSPPRRSRRQCAVLIGEDPARPEFSGTLYNASRDTASKARSSSRSARSTSPFGPLGKCSNVAHALLAARPHARAPTLPLLPDQRARRRQATRRRTSGTTERVSRDEIKLGFGVDYDLA